MAENNFKKLMAEEERQNPPPPEIEENIFSNLHILQLMGETMELYLPNAAEFFISMLGGSMELPELGTQIEGSLIGGASEGDESEEEPGGAGESSEEEDNPKN